MTGHQMIVRVTIGGDVQGVGYRTWMEMEARAGGVRGWVRNRLNGDVEALFAGPPDAVEGLCRACARGQGGGRGSGPGGARRAGVSPDRHALGQIAFRRRPVRIPE